MLSESICAGTPQVDRLAHNHPRIVQRLLTNMSLDLASRLRKVSVQAAACNHNGLPGPAWGPRTSNTGS